MDGKQVDYFEIKCGNVTNSMAIGFASYIRIYHEPANLTKQVFHPSEGNYEFTNPVVKQGLVKIYWKVFLHIFVNTSSSLYIPVKCSCSLL